MRWAVLAAEGRINSPISSDIALYEINVSCSNFEDTKGKIFKLLD